MKILCSICARGNSKGLKNKNIKLFNGRPLIWHSINQARKSKIFSKIICSSDSSKILKIAKDSGVDLNIKRSKKLSSGKCPKKDVIKDVILKAEKFYGEKYDLIFDLDITSPVRKIKDIKNCLKALKKIKKPCNLITICESKKNPHFNMIKIKNKKLSIAIPPKKDIPSRQLAPKIYDMNASIYAWNRKGFFKLKDIINQNTIYYKMPISSSFDIDSVIDFKISELLFKKIFR